MKIGTYVCNDLFRDQFVWYTFSCCVDLHIKRQHSYLSYMQQEINPRLFRKMYQQFGIWVGAFFAFESTNI